MRKSLIAISLAFAASGAAFAQVGTGVVGSLGGNGAISNLGTTRLGGDIGASAQANGADPRAGLNAETRGGLRIPRTNTGASTSVDAAASGSGITFGATGAAAGATQTPVLDGSSWGSAQPGAAQKRD